MGKVPTRAPRVAGEVRRGLLLDAAEALVLEQGGPPAAAPAISRRAGVSKALIYTYFPTQPDLANALLARRLAALEAAGLADASRLEPLEAAALACARLYVDHVATQGPLVHLILRDRAMAAALTPDNRRAFERVYRRLGRLARRTLGLPARDVRLLLNLITTIPEEAGRLAFAGEITVESARELTATLVEAALRAGY